MTVIAVIPARYASVRFPGKPLALLAGRPMILHVVDAARAARRVDGVIVATDDPRIAACVREAGAEAVMTSPRAASGTDRVAEVARARRADAWVNLQGDEPLMAPGNLDLVVETLFGAPDRGIATLAVSLDPSDAADPNVVKTAVARDGRGLYFSRAAIPYVRNGAPAYRKHLGIYAFRAPVLEEISGLSPSPLERAESLEQLRWLEAGYSVWVGEGVGDSIGIDTPADLAEAERRLKQEEVAP